MDKPHGIGSIASYSIATEQGLPTIYRRLAKFPGEMHFAFAVQPRNNRLDTLTDIAESPAVGLVILRSNYLRNAARYWRCAFHDGGMLSKRPV